MPDGTRRAYDTVAATYAAKLHDELDAKPFDRQRLDDFATRLAGAGPVVDLGCGPGHVAAYLKARGVEAIGLDLSPGMIAEASARHPAIPFRQADMRALPFAKGELAGILAFYSIIHIPPDEVPAVLHELYRVLRPGGLLFLAFHLGNHTLHLDDWWEHAVDVDFFFFEREAMEAWLRAAGFALVDARDREPYPGVETPTRRGYILAAVPD
jgi:SAM-dependent methyltransferase